MKKLLVLIILFAACICLTGCETSAQIVSRNLSKESDEFKVRRRITFINLRTGEYLFTMTGVCSIQGGATSVNNELEVICRVGDHAYQKHYLFLAQETTYVVEQMESNDVSRYDYEFVFKPQSIIQTNVKIQTGEE